MNIRSRLEVMEHLCPWLEEKMETLLRPVEALWQPTDFLPDMARESGHDELVALQKEAAALPDDVLSVLVGDTVTEEALPTYAYWLACIEGISEAGAAPRSPWAVWNRAWCAEENRHGDVLSRYLVLSGRVNMREVDVVINNLIYDGMDIQTGRDPYRFFVYTSFQELATNRSHRNVGNLAKSVGAETLTKMSGVIAGDEGWHARAYRTFVEKFLEIDTDEAVLAIADLFKKQIKMPAMNMREAGVERGVTFKVFEALAQRIKVYTAQDYLEILAFLVDHWKIPALTGLSTEAEKAQEFICGLPDRYRKLLARTRIPTAEELPATFRWLTPAVAG
ncbi:MAG: acyl-ACP desaturase [Kiritimatiellia bacterium]|jgi:acyl-[acyl-carrier-protein] desaturase|nr:acyl-ACP desaturase [Kiritimatiellia bacterium]